MMREQIANDLARLCVQSLLADPEFRNEIAREAARAIRVLSTSQVAAILGCHRSTIERSETLQKMAYHDADTNGKRWRLVDLEAHQRAKWQAANLGAWD